MSPAEIAQTASEVGIAKAKNRGWKLLILGILAGMFIALAGVGATFGNNYVGKLAGACIFPAGLAMVIVAGSELFTGNNLMIIALFNKKITFGQMMKNWGIVFAGNLIGAVLVAALVVFGGVFDGVADSVIATANAKISMGFVPALIRGILCNFLVCIAVWMAFGAKTVAGKIIAVFFPIMLFVLCGFEHSVANMFYIPAGIFEVLKTGAEAGSLNVGTFLLNNLLPVTLGNIIGGAGLVGCVYWLVYAKPTKKKH